MTARHFMVFDVESIGLHGEGFAVAYVVVNDDGKVVEERRIACDPDLATGSPASRDWVRANVPDLSPYLSSPRAVRNEFWVQWKFWKSRGALLVADCAWPVEARFLAACVDEFPEMREWEGPYPLHDLASVLLALGQDPLATQQRLEDELPAHDPLADARQSARILVAALARGG